MQGEVPSNRSKQNPKFEECMDITNVNVDMKECKKILEKFSECFNVHKPEALR